MVFYQIAGALLTPKGKRLKAYNLLCGAIAQIFLAVVVKFQLSVRLA